MSFPNLSYQKKSFAVQLILLVTLVVIFSNCSTEKVKEVPNLIEQHQFAEILAECQLVESQGTVLRIEQPYYKDSLHNYYASVFEKYKITPDQFYESLQHYTKDPNLMQVIYSETLEILQSKIANFEDLEVPSKAIAPISNAVLAEIILDTPFYQSLLDDSLTLSPLLRDSIFNYLDSFPDIAKENTTNNASAQFTFGIHQKNSGMYEQLLKLIINNIDKKNGKD